MSVLYDPKVLTYDQYVDGVHIAFLEYTLIGKTLSNLDFLLNKPFTFTLLMSGADRRSWAITAGMTFLNISLYVFMFPLIIPIDGILTIVAYCRGQSKYLEHRAKKRRLYFEAGAILAGAITFGVVTLLALEKLRPKA